MRPRRTRTLQHQGRRRDRSRRSALVAVAVAYALVMLPAAAAAPGDLDPGFGSGGKVVTDFGSAASVQALALLPNGKIVAAGQAGVDFALARYLPDGTLDPVFAGDGTVTTDFGAIDRIFGVAVQMDGKIVAAGHTRNAGFTAGDFVVARYKRDGSLDPAFGSSGAVITDLGGVDLGYDVVLQRDGKIVVVGGSNAGGSDYHFTALRYEVNGSLDSSFGANGIVTTDFGDIARAVEVQADGRIVAGGDAQLGDRDFALARLSTNGSLDASFGGDGTVTTDFPTDEFSDTEDGVLDLVVQPNGKIVAAGSSWNDARSYYAFALARYNPDGSLDTREADWALGTSFGDDGRVTTTFEGDHESAGAVAVQTNGKIVAAGYQATNASDFEFALARYEYDGSLDASFGTNGRVTTAFGPAAMAQAVAVQSNGCIAAAGSDGEGRFALARYLGDPASEGAGIAPGVP